MTSPASASANQGPEAAAVAPSEDPWKTGELAILAVLGVAALVSIALLVRAALRLPNGAVDTRVAWNIEHAATGDAALAEGGVAEQSTALADDALPATNVLAAVAARVAQAVPDPAQLTAREGALAVQGRAAEIPRYERWELVFPSGLTEVDYAYQLDALGIELGILWPDGQIEYVTGVSQLMPVRRKAPAADEKRFYLSWGQGDLAQADQNLLAKAGVAGAPPVVVHFLTAAAEARLAELEQAFAGRAATTVYRTRFGVRMAKGGYEFHVLEQQPRG